MLGSWYILDELIGVIYKKFIYLWIVSVRIAQSMVQDTRSVGKQLQQLITS